MFIRKYWRHLCLTFAAFFWSSCGDDSNSVTPPDNGGAVVPPAESSANVVGESSSSEESLEAISSSSLEPVRDTSVITLFSDPSVTCEKDATWIVSPIYALGRKSAGSCEEIQILVEKGSAYSKEELEEMEDSLENCRRYMCETVTAYGVISYPPVIGHRTSVNITYKCSNREQYYSSYSFSGLIKPENSSFPRDENGVLYLTEEEYNAAKLSRASMAKATPKFAPEPDSSNTEETVPPECDRMGFVEVDEIYESASKTLYAKYADELANDSLSEDRRNFLNQVCDEQNSTIRKDILPEYDVYYENLSSESQCSLKGWLDDSIWFSGYIARYQKRPDGTVEETERYREKFSAILNKLEEVIESKYKPKLDDSDMMS
ncbi:MULTISPECIES: hypothetical protein [unclassified Fibrobacter]|uniref:hypothetical protein n=1 Tax=unclassified Fibrobacter TaxID=2634177 RepID=UPI000D6D18AB|nr:MULTISPECIES: hypothetical protein [unclassified Fibrobacter]PWJ63750.1 hypothetical protein BGX12_11769 [Fibrobacter sp. UWR4]PZW69138.1 hypothetical protein C8E88_101670 [Fibrobacter sp. UWR1]